MLLAGRGLRRPGGDARRAGLLKAARAVGVPAALEVSRSGIGAHVWIFFTGPVPAATARTLGSGLLREAIALRGRMDLSSYDRLFPSQDVLPRRAGIGNLIAAPLQGRLAQGRRDGLPRPGDPGAARGPVGVPGPLAPAVTARGGPARRAGRPGAGGCRGRPAGAGHRDAHPAPAGAGGAA